MGKAHGKVKGRRFLESYTGDASQFAGVRRFTLEEGRAAGSSYAEVWTGGGLRFTVALGRALDLSDAFFGGKSLCWRSPAGDAAAGLNDSHGLGWLRNFFGGLLTTCGLTHAGAPADIDGQHYGLHGPISNTPAEEISCRTEWRGDDLVITVSGKVRQGVLFGEKLMLHRTIEAHAFDNRVFIHDVVENTGHESEPLMLLYHINAGYPVVEEGSRLLVNVDRMDPMTEHSRRGMEDFDKFPAPERNYVEKVYFITPRPDAKGENVAAVTNAAGDFGLSVRWRHEEMPCMGEWKMMGYRDYTVGVEPCTTFLWPRQRLLDEGLMPYIEPGEAKDFHVEIGVLASNEEVSRLSAEIDAAAFEGGIERG